MAFENLSAEYAFHVTNSMNAIDTIVFIYACDHADPVKQVLDEELLDRLMKNSSQTLLLWQVAVEFLAYWRKLKNLGTLNEVQVRSYFDQTVQMFPVQMPTIAVLERSFTMQSRYSLSHWDSLLIAACRESAVDTLYSEDMQHGATCGGDAIINPFL